MKNIKINNQNGSMLLMSLIVLMALSIMTAGSLRSLQSEQRMTLNREIGLKIENIAYATIRDIEAMIIEDNEFRMETYNCDKNRMAQEKYCLQNLSITGDSLNAFVSQPIDAFDAKWGTGIRWRTIDKQNKGQHTYVDDRTTLQVNAANLINFDSAANNPGQKDAKCGVGTAHYVVNVLLEYEPIAPATQSRRKMMQSIVLRNNDGIC